MSREKYHMQSWELADNPLNMTGALEKAGRYPRCQYSANKQTHLPFQSFKTGYYLFLFPVSSGHARHSSENTVESSVRFLPPPSSLPPSLHFGVQKQAATYMKEGYGFYFFMFYDIIKLLEKQK